MKLHPEDPRLTAYLLGELPADEAAAVERAIAADPALQSAAAELENIRDLLTETLDPGSIRLLPAQKGNIRRSIQAEKSTLSLVPGKSLTRWVLPLAAAAAVALIAGIAMLNSGGDKPRTARQTPAEQTSDPQAGQSPKVKLLPAPGPADAGKTAPTMAAKSPSADTDLPALRPRSYLAAADFPTLDLPVQAGKSSLDWIRKSIVENHKLPEHDAVRLEEILNSYSLRPAGVTVVARSQSIGWHPDNRGDGSTSHAATIATETIACPWKPSASLVLVSIKGNPYNDCEIKAVFRANTENVRRYRLLGFSPVEGMDQAPLPTLLPAKSATTLVLEVEPSNSAAEIGAIEWSVNGENAAPVTLTRHGEAEPSDDARFAALVCTYALWLTKDGGGLVDTDLLAALAREIASESLSGDRVELLNLIDQSLHL